METLPSVVESPQGTQQESHRIPSNSNMDETSGTMIMIAQSKALFDRLEIEAKVGNILLLCLSVDFYQKELRSSVCVNQLTTLYPNTINFTKAYVHVQLKSSEHNQPMSNFRSFFIFSRSVCLIFGM